jgi:hypothetical protein
MKAVHRRRTIDTGHIVLIGEKLTFATSCSAIPAEKISVIIEELMTVSAPPFIVS